jgi:chorismate mutase
MQNFTAGDDPLSLDRIRSVLVRLEETIIFCPSLLSYSPGAENATTYVQYGPIALIERSQFAHNPKIYEKGAFQALTDIGFRGSWLQWFLKETETFHGTLKGWIFHSGP